MNIDKWFFSQSKVVQIILLVIPFVGWVFDILVRWSNWSKNGTTTNLVAAIVYSLLGEFWILHVLDGIFVALDKPFLFYE